MASIHMYLVYRYDRSSGTYHLNLKDYSDQDNMCFNVYLVSHHSVKTEYKTGSAFSDNARTGKFYIGLLCFKFPA